MAMAGRAVKLTTAGLSREVALIVGMTIVAGVGDDSRVGAVLDGHLGQNVGLSKPLLVPCSEFHKSRQRSRTGECRK